MEEKTNSYKILVGKTKGKTALRTPRHWWKGKIGMVLKWNGMGSCGLHSSGSS